MKEETSRIWVGAGAVLVMASGLLSAGGSLAGTSTPWLGLFNLLNAASGAVLPQFSADARVVNAVLGGVMVGWGLLILLLRDRRLPWALVRFKVLVSLLVWFAVDSTGSLAAGCPGNLVLNAAFAAFFLPPLILVKPASKTGSVVP